jgi:hypothetical protein
MAAVEVEQKDDDGVETGSMAVLEGDFLGSPLLLHSTRGS